MDTRPCSVCGGGDAEGTMLACVESPSIIAFIARGSSPGVTTATGFALIAPSTKATRTKRSRLRTKKERLRENLLPRAREFCAVV